MSDLAAKPTPKPRLFAKPMLGWAFIFMVAALLILFALSLYYILPLLTQPPGFIDQYVKDNPKKLDASFIVALEYESYAIRTQGIQVALGLLVGLFMAAFGMLLFAIGATDDFGVDGEHNESKINIKSSAPGLVVLIISGVVISFAVAKDVRRSFDASFKEGKDSVIKSNEREPPGAKALDGKSPQHD